MTGPRFFGYGSLVNLATHDYPDARPARLAGWRRVWRHTTLRPAAFLSVEAAPGVEIDGITAAVPASDWDALDAREYAYLRRDVSNAVFHPCGTVGAIAVYEAQADLLSHPSVIGPILLSYVDVVAQGYMKLYGETGAENFFATTSGWDAPVLDDRAAPRYPRHQPVTPEERAFVDEQLRNLGARRHKPD